jgi:hypothetical protein
MERGGRGDVEIGRLPPEWQKVGFKRVTFSNGWNTLAPPDETNLGSKALLEDIARPLALK